MSAILNVLVAMAQSFVYSAITGSSDRNYVGAGTPTGSVLTVNTDGTWQLTTGGATATISPSGVQNYATPNGAGVGPVHWVRFDSVSGTIPVGPAFATWISLAAAQSLTMSAAPALTVTGVIRVRIATDPSGANVVSDGNVTLSSTND